MKVLIRPGIILVGGLVAIGGAVTAYNWRLARDAASSRADYFEERVLGHTQRERSLIDRYTDILAQYAVLSNEVTQVRQRQSREHAANEPLRREVERLIGNEIRVQTAVRTRDDHLATARTQLSNSTERVQALEAELARVRHQGETAEAANKALTAGETKLKAELAAALAARDAAAKKTAEQTAGLAAAGKDIETLKQTLAARDTELATARQSVQSLTAEIESLRKAAPPPPPPTAPAQPPPSEPSPSP